MRNCLMVPLRAAVAVDVDPARARRWPTACPSNSAGCLLEARSDAGSVRTSCPQGARDRRWTLAHASKAVCANQLPAWLSAKRTAAFGSALRAPGSVVGSRRELAGTISGAIEGTSLAHSTMNCSARYIILAEVNVGERDPARGTGEAGLAPAWLGVSRVRRERYRAC